MKLQFRHQKFQAEAAKAVVDVFAGQPYLTSNYMIDRGKQEAGSFIGSLEDYADFTGWANAKIVPQLTDSVIVEQIQRIQRENLIPSPVEQKWTRNLTIEMETGVGKTYTYIKTMYELNKHYGWSKFIIVVPSIAIREGVYKSFEVTQEHFTEEYRKKIRFFIYNSARLSEIDRFASDSAINVMIINMQAFNKSVDAQQKLESGKRADKNAAIIFRKIDDFRSRRPIDVISKTNPILIIDEPQSVEGKQTKENLKAFHPLFTLRYSATHKADSIYNMVYRLDALDAYKKQLVKKISVKGISVAGTTATEGYVYLESIDCSGAFPMATIQFDCKTKSGSIKTTTRKVSEKYNLYPNSGELEEYRDGYVVKRIDGRDDSVEFLNGVKIFRGDAVGQVSEEQFRRIQIRETILSHIRKERDLFHKGVKVLSLFFIDEVAHYREYDAAGQPQNGMFADMFEEEYADVVETLQREFEDTEYVKYLDSIAPSTTHAGYFSIDKKGRMTNSKLSDKGEKTSDDIDAYDLIMKNKELLLERDPKKSPVRFIFSHSALREGWDNPNVFQICTLKQSGSDVRKRQEVGRGLRLCVNQYGERMDANLLGADVHSVNVLTVIASESYDSFAKGLQSELAEAVGDRPRAVTEGLFKGRTVKDSAGNSVVIDEDTARAIYLDLFQNGYIDKKGLLTEKYYADRKNGEVKVAEEAKDCAADVIRLLDSVYDPKAFQPENEDAKNVELRLRKDRLNMPEFQALWKRINAKSVYVVDFDSDELIRKCITALNEKLHVPKVYFKVETGQMSDMGSKETLLAGEAMRKTSSESYDGDRAIAANAAVKYDLIGKLVEATSLTRHDIVVILTGIQKSVFNQFHDNPEEFIARAGALINDEKATAIIQHITYHVLDEHYETEIFTDSTIRGRLDVNAMKTERHLYDHLVYDSTVERKFASELDVNQKVAVYVKLPGGFYISTPLGKYNPDWAIAFHEGAVKHVYFVAETKGSMDSLNLNHISPVEQAKIDCAKAHFRAISTGEVQYDVVSSYDELLELVTK